MVVLGEEYLLIALEKISKYSTDEFSLYTLSSKPSLS